MLNENAEKTDLKSIFVRNNKQNSDIAITKKKKTGMFKLNLKLTIHPVFFKNEN